VSFSIAWLSENPSSGNPDKANEVRMNFLLSSADIDN
jgi:hypothetical protein